MATGFFLPKTDHPITNQNYSKYFFTIMTINYDLSRQRILGKGSLGWQDFVFHLL